jgi:hypothetical protein
MSGEQVHGFASARGRPAGEGRSCIRGQSTTSASPLSCALGDASAYAALLGEVAALAREMVRRRFGFLQPQDVEDLVQDVLLSVHAARSTYDPGRPFLP